MRISDWSSDVCSSDLRGREADPAAGRTEALQARQAEGQQVAALGAGEGVQLVDRHALQVPEHLRRVVVAQQQGEGLRRGHEDAGRPAALARSEEHTSELQSLMRISYAVFCFKKKKKNNTTRTK